MFAMRYESGTLATKKINEDVFKELDKGRNEKGYEYAALVSLLEPDSEHCKSDIVNVSHRFPKMHEAPPQFRDHLGATQCGAPVAVVQARVGAGEGALG